MFSGAGSLHVQEMLSKFLMPREVQVLSLRYGLVSPDEDGDGVEIRPVRLLRRSRRRFVWPQGIAVSLFNDFP